jgi:DnaJ domain
MPTPSDNIEALVAAYRRLDVDLRASKSAIRHHYLELAREHHPDKWPGGSPQQEQAASRMRAINTAYDHIKSAPLRDHVFASEPVPPLDAASPRSIWTRPPSALVETLLRFALGAAIGGLVAFRLYDRGVPGTAAYGPAIPLLLGFAFTSTRRASSVFRVLWLWW